MSGGVETAVVLMNLGGPDNLEAVAPFLFQIFSDPDVIQLPLGSLYQRRLARWLARKRAPESRAHYERIGGRSPIVERTGEQARLLEARLGAGFKAYLAMRASRPSTEEAVEALVSDGASRIVALPLYPHRSRTTTLSSLRELARVLAARSSRLPVHEVCCYPSEPLFLDAWAERIRQTLQGVPAERRAAMHLLFSAHGLPRRLIAAGDPYLTHVERTVRGVMDRVGAGRPHGLAFQSRATRVRWLEPSTQDALAQLGRRGLQDVAVVPISFLTDHVETLYELDILMRAHAREAGIEGFHRVASLNDSSLLAEALAGLVRRALETRAPVCEGGVDCPRP